jgi:hypothetical protein
MPVVTLINSMLKSRLLTKYYKMLAKTLFSRYVTYHEINKKTGKIDDFHVSRWVDKIGYEQDSGLVKI